MARDTDRIHQAGAEERYRLLLEFGHSLSGTLGPIELYRLIHREIDRVLDATGFYVSLYDEARDLATVVFYSDRGEEIETDISYRGSDSAVIRSGEGSVVDDGLQEQAIMTLGPSGSPVTRSALSVPLRFSGRVRGVLSVQSYQAGAYNTDDLRFFQAVSDIATVALENARYVAELKTRRREAERMETIGYLLAGSLQVEDVLRQVLDAATELLQADGAGFWFVEGNGARLTASAGAIGLPVGTLLPLSGGAVRAILTSRKPLILDDVPGSDELPQEAKDQSQASSAVIAPLVMGDDVLGAVSVGTTRPRRFNAEESDLLMRLANQAAVALRNARLHAELQALSLTDPLTGLPNRRHLELHIRREMAAARRGRDLAVILFDLDNFKQYNDRAGHLEGDEALRRVGRILAEETRAMNLVARYGGDEFVSVLSDTTFAGAEYHAERVRERMARDERLGTETITISYGVAEYDPSMGHEDDLIRAADDALYRSKGGRPTLGADGVSP